MDIFFGTTSFILINSSIISEFFRKIIKSPIWLCSQMLYMKNSPALCMFISEISIKLFSVLEIIAVLTGAVRRSSRRSLIDRGAVSGPVPCSGAKRRDKVLDEVSTAIHGGAAAVNAPHHLHPKPTKILANASFYKAFAKAKNGSALGVSVNAVVIFISLIKLTFSKCMMRYSFFCPSL